MPAPQGRWRRASAAPRRRSPPSSLHVVVHDRRLSTADARPTPPCALHATQRDGYLVEMSRAQGAAQPRCIIAAVAFWLAIALPANAQVILQAQSTSVANPGDIGHICVVMATNGQKVAGIQSTLAWDGTCATLSDPPHCFAVGSHGKQVHVP